MQRRFPFLPLFKKFWTGCHLNPSRCMHTSSLSIVASHGCYETLTGRIFQLRKNFGAINFHFFFVETDEPKLSSSSWAKLKSHNPLPIMVFKCLPSKVIIRSQSTYLETLTEISSNAPDPYIEQNNPLLVI